MKCRDKKRLWKINPHKREHKGNMSPNILGWPKTLFGVFHIIIQKNMNKISGQLNMS